MDIQYFNFLRMELCLCYQNKTSTDMLEWKSRQAKTLFKIKLKYWWELGFPYDQYFIYFYFFYFNTYKEKMIGKSLASCLMKNFEDPFIILRYGSYFMYAHKGMFYWFMKF